MVSTKKIDDIDAKILKDLFIDGRKKFIEIAREAQVSKDIIWQHYKNMKKNGIIIGATIELNYASLGYNITANFSVDVPPKEMAQVVEQLRKIPGLYGVVGQSSPSRLSVMSDMMKVEQIDYVKQRIKNLPSVIGLEVGIWTGVRSMQENLSVLNIDKIPSGTEKTEPQPKKRNKKTECKIDDIDRKIIEKLTFNGRASFNSIGKEIGISTSSVIRRYNDLKRNGIIKVLIQINPLKIGYVASACFKLTSSAQENIADIANRVAIIPDVFAIIKTIDICDLMVFVEIKDFEHLFALETEIANIEGVRKIDTTVIPQLSKLPYPRQHMSTF